MRLFILGLVTGLCLLGVAPHLAAQETPLARVTMVSGTVTLEKASGNAQPVRQGMPLAAGDTLVTGGDGRVTFTFDRGDIFRLYGDSQLSIDELTGQEQMAQPSLRLSLGHLWTRIKRSLTTPFEPSLHTTTAVLGVRGTEFETVVSLDAASAVVVDEGRVAVATEKTSLVLDAGQAAEMEVDDRPTTPFAAMPRAQRDWRGWREKRRQKLMAVLPARLPHLRRRFDLAAERMQEYSETMRQAARRLDGEIAAAGRALTRGERRKARASATRVLRMEKRFHQASGRFPQGAQPHAGDRGAFPPFRAVRHRQPPPCWPQKGGRRW
jgi:hypothetical protein